MHVLAAVLSSVLVLGGCQLIEDLRASEDDPAQPVSQPQPAPEDADDQQAVEDQEATEDQEVAEDSQEDGREDGASGVQPGQTPDEGASDDDVFVAQLHLPDRPEEMALADEDGAAAAAEFFLYTYTYAYGTGDAEPLLEISGPDCGFCASVAAGVDEAHTGGEYMRTGDPQITSIVSAPGAQPQIDFQVQIEAEMPAMLIFDEAHEVTGQVPAARVVVSVAMAHEAEHWLVVGAGMQ